jgi:hypothetical protein
MQDGRIQAAPKNRLEVSIVQVQMVACFATINLFISTHPRKHRSRFPSPARYPMTSVGVRQRSMSIVQTNSRRGIRLQTTGEDQGADGGAETHSLFGYIPGDLRFRSGFIRPELPTTTQAGRSVYVQLRLVQRNEAHRSAFAAPFGSLSFFPD